MITKSTTRRRRNLLRLMVHATATGAVASLAAASMALASPAAAAVTTTSQPDANEATLAGSQQSIIMSDGRICNPRWGC